MKNVGQHLKDGFRIIGYFSYTSTGEVTCEGDACIIAGTEELMHSYINRIVKTEERSIKSIIKKTRFSEIIVGMLKGAAYAFDEEAYNKFLYVAKLNGVTDLPISDFSSVPSPTGMHFIRIQYGQY